MKSNDASNVSSSDQYSGSWGLDLIHKRVVDTESHKFRSTEQQYLQTLSGSGVPATWCALRFTVCGRLRLMYRGHTPTSQNDTTYKRYSAQSPDKLLGLGFSISHQSLTRSIQPRNLHRVKPILQQRRSMYQRHHRTPARCRNQAGMAGVSEHTLIMGSKEGNAVGGFVAEFTFGHIEAPTWKNGEPMSQMPIGYYYGKN